MPQQILIEPHITEKTISFTQSNKYTFYVNPNSNKSQISNAIKENYNVHPIKITIINKKGKNVIFKGRFKGTRKLLKKAIVTLPKNEKIKEFIIKEK